MASRVAWASIAVNIFLSLLNLTIAVASGSLAVAAEMVHNLVDLLPRCQRIERRVRPAGA
jgi:divalent metal cation (Fe/Co/Zn/Cd) transporter